MDASTKGFFMTELDRRATDTGRRILATAERLKTIATHLRDDELGQSAAGLAEGGARSLERLGRYLQERDGEALVRDAERFGRERPWMVSTGGVLLGFAASRMLKASAAQRHGDGDPGYRWTAGVLRGDAASASTASIGGLAPLSSEPIPIVTPEPDFSNEGQVRRGS